MPQLEGLFGDPVDQHLVDRKVGVLRSSKFKVGDAVETKRDVKLEKTDRCLPGTIFPPGTQWTVSSIFVEEHGKYRRLVRRYRISASRVSLIVSEGILVPAGTNEVTK